jgi:hypothetical protein
MSLRWVHVLFITLATVLAIWIGVWCLRSAAAVGGVYQVMGYSLIALAAGMIGYGLWFVRKTRGMS